MNNPEIFWNWFSANSEQLTMLDDLAQEARGQLLDDMQRQLEQYCEGLSYEIGEPTPAGRTVTFSAEGDFGLFSHVVNLVESAPDIDWWEFVAFKQPRGKDLKVRFDKYLFETAKMWFLQLECEEEPDVTGLRIALPGLTADYRPDLDTDEDRQVGVYVTIEALLGEFDCTTLIGYIELCPVPDKPADAGFQPLDDLPDFIEWFKHKRENR